MIALFISQHTGWAKSFGWTARAEISRGSKNITLPRCCLFFCLFVCLFFTVLLVPFHFPLAFGWDWRCQGNESPSNCIAAQHNAASLFLYIAPVCQPDSSRPHSIPHDKHFQSLKKNKKERSFLLLFYRKRERESRYCRRLNAGTTGNAEILVERNGNRRGNALRPNKKSWRRESLSCWCNPPASI